MEALGVHLAPGGVRAALVDDEGQVRATAAGSDDLASIVLDTMPQAPGIPAPRAVGLAIDVLDAADHQPVREVLARYGRVEPVAAGAAAAVAEAWIGAAAGLSHVVCLWIGEQVLAGVLLHGTPWTGAHGLAGAAGWMTLNPVERQDYRRFGCLAAEVSTRGIARRLVWRIQTGDPSAVLREAGSLEAITAAHVFTGARQGDGVAISVVRDTAKYLGMAAANLVTTLDPDIVVIAGPVTTAGDLLIDAVRHEAIRRLAPVLAARFRCEISPLGEDGVAIGAARVAALAAR